MKEKNRIGKEIMRRIPKVVMVLAIAAAMVMPVSRVFAEEHPKPVEHGKLTSRFTVFSLASPEGATQKHDKTIIPEKPMGLNIEDKSIIGGPDTTEGEGPLQPIWLHFDNGENYNAIGLTNGGTFEYAIRLTPDELGSFEGYAVTTVRWYVGYDDSPNPPFSGNIIIYGPGTSSQPGDVLYTQPYTTPGGSGWFEVPLDEAVEFDPTQDLWISIEVTHAAGEYPAGCDIGPAVDGKGDWVAIGGVWEELQNYGLDYNWNLWAGIEPAGPPPPPPPPPENDVGIVDLTIDGKSIQLDKGGCNVFHPGMHIPDVEVKNYGTINWVYPKPEGMSNESWAGKKATFVATIWAETSNVEFESGFEDNILGDWNVTDEDGKCCDWWNRSSQRVHSGDYSMKCSRYDTYMPCAYDILQTRKPNDMSPYDEGYFEFWFWVEGDWKYTDGWLYLYDYGWVEVSNDGGETWQTLEFDIYKYDPSLGVDVKIDSGADVFFDQEYQWDTSEWLKAKVRLDDYIELTDKMFFRFVWISDCFIENEGWYIDDVRKIGVVHQGEIIWQSHKQVNLTANESKHIEFKEPELELYGEKHKEYRYWYMVEFKNVDDNPANDVKKDLIIIRDWHDVGITDIEIENAYQQALLKSDLVPVNVTVPVKNFGSYNEENVPVEIKVYNLKQVTVWEDDVEAPPPGYEHGGFDSPDLWHRSTRDAHSGQYSWYCGEEDIGFYDNNMYINYLVTPVFRFDDMKAKSAYVDFWAKWSFEHPNDTWRIVLVDPESNYILGWNPYSYYSRDIGYETLHPGEHGAPEWWGPEHNWGHTTPLIGSTFHYDLFAMIDWWRENYGAYGIFVNPDGTPSYDVAIGWAIWSTDEQGYIEPDMPEKWSGLFIDDIKVVAEVPDQIQFEQTKYIDIPDQGAEVPVEFRWCPLITFGDFEVEVTTKLDIDQDPSNNFIDGLTHSYLVRWLDKVEYPKDPKTGEYIHNWTHEDLTTLGETDWHIEHAKCGRYNVLTCGYVDDYDQYHYRDNWDDAIEPKDCPFDLSMVQGVKLEFDFCAELFPPDYFGNGEPGDWFYVEASGDSGQNWEKIYQFTGFTEWYGDCWQHVEIPIVDPTLLTENFHFRFRLKTDDAEYAPGIFIDNVLLEEIEFETEGNQTIEVKLLDETFCAGPGGAEFPPEGWTDEANAWAQSDSNYAGGESFEAMASWSLIVPGAMFYTCPIDTTGYTNLNFKFKTYVNHYSGSTYYTLHAAVSTDGSTWTDVWTVTPSGSFQDWINVTITDAEGVGGTIYLGWYLTGDPFYINYWYLDDIELVTPDGDTIFYEDFGTPPPHECPFPPEGWEVEQTSTEVWIDITWGDLYITYWHSEDYPAGSPGGASYLYHSPFFSAEVWWAMNVAQDEGLITYPIDFTDNALYELQFWTYVYGVYETPDEEHDYIEYSIDGGEHWVPLEDLHEKYTYPGGNFWNFSEVYDVSFLQGNENVQFRFHRVTPAGGIGVWAVDDIKIIKRDVEIVGSVGDEIRWIFNDDFEFGWKWHTPRAPKDLWHVHQAGDGIGASVPEPSVDAPEYSKSNPEGHFWADEKNHTGIWTYMNFMDNILISPELSLYQAYDAKLHFWAYGEVGSGDHCYVAVRKIVNGEPQEWGVVYEVELADGWNEYIVDLNPWVEPNAVIQIGFRFMSDGLLPLYTGWKVDDIKLDIKPDETPPVTECKISGKMGNEGYYVGPVTVELTATDDLSGVWQTWYRVDGGEWKLYEGRFQVTADCDHLVEYYSIDKVGNVEDVKSCPEFKIDATPPTVSIVTPEEGYIYVMGRQLFRNPLGGTIIIGGITFEASASDAKSGVSYVHFEVNGFAYDDMSSPYAVYWHKFDLLPHKYTLTVTAYDIAGNKGADATTSFLHWL